MKNKVTTKEEFTKVRNRRKRRLFFRSMKQHFSVFCGHSWLISSIGIVGIGAGAGVVCLGVPSQTCIWLIGIAAVVAVFGIVGYAVGADEY